METYKNSKFKTDEEDEETTSHILPIKSEPTSEEDDGSDDEADMALPPAPASPVIPQSIPSPTISRTLPSPANHRGPISPTSAPKIVPNFPVKVKAQTKPIQAQTLRPEGSIDENDAELSKKRKRKKRKSANMNATENAPPQSVATQPVIQETDPQPVKKNIALKTVEKTVTASAPLTPSKSKRTKRGAPKQSDEQ